MYSTMNYLDCCLCCFGRRNYPPPFCYLDENERKRLNRLYATPCVSQEYICCNPFFDKKCMKANETIVTKKQRQSHLLEATPKKSRRQYYSSTPSTSTSFTSHSSHSHKHKKCCCCCCCCCHDSVETNKKTCCEHLDQNIQTLIEKTDKFTQTYMINLLDKQTVTPLKSQPKKRKKSHRSERKRCCCCCCNENRRNCSTQEQKSEIIQTIKAQQPPYQAKQLREEPQICLCCSKCRGKIEKNEEPRRFLLKTICCS